MLLDCMSHAGPQWVGARPRSQSWAYGSYTGARRTSARARLDGRSRVETGHSLRHACLGDHGEWFGMLPVSDIALRCAAGWLLGVSTIAAVSGYTVRLSRKGSVPLWTGFAAIAGNICWVGACAGIGFLLGRLAPRQDLMLTIALYVCGFVAALWVTSILIQLAQNLAYRAVGAPMQRIRWYNGQQSRAHRTKKRTAGANVS